MPRDEKILEYINHLKTRGLRPSLICALVVNNRVGLLGSNKYPGWEFLQGGIEFRETPIETLEREVVEELGYHFYQSCHFPPEKFIWLFEDQMQTKISGTLLTEEGKEIKPIAKYYIIFAAILRADQFPHVNPDDSNFKGTTVKLHKCKWTNYQEARELVKTNQNPKKREIAERILEKLKEKNFIE